MLKRILGILLLLFVLCPLGMALTASDPKDKEGSKDPPIFNRMPNFWIYSYIETEFDRYEFPAGDNKQTTVVEGHYYWIIYYAKDKTNAPSGLRLPPLWHLLRYRQG